MISPKGVHRKTTERLETQKPYAENTGDHYEEIKDSLDISSGISNGENDNKNSPS